jgi:hypothetical protein
MKTKRYKPQLDELQLTSIWKSDRIPRNRGTFQIRPDLSATVTKRRPVNNISLWYNLTSPAAQSGVTSLTSRFLTITFIRKCNGRFLDEIRNFLHSLLIVMCCDNPPDGPPSKHSFYSLSCGEFQASPSNLHGDFRLRLIIRLISWKKGMQSLSQFSSAKCFYQATAFTRR